MNGEPYIAETAALIGDPARANMLLALMDGRALSASELAEVAGVTAQTTSGHLAKLLGANLIVVERQGRHRYYRLASERVAQALEALSVLSGDGAPRHRPTGPRDEAMRFARTCYDHLAGQLGVAITVALIDRGYLVEGERDFELTTSGESALREFGIDIAAERRRRRAFARRCLDWSERRAHLGGALGASLLARCQELDWLARTPDSRAVTLTTRGKRGLSDAFSITLD